MLWLYLKLLTFSRQFLSKSHSSHVYGIGKEGEEGIFFVCLG